MSTEDMIWIASIAIAKGLDYSQLYCCDYLYNQEHMTGDVWAYVEECKKIGRIAFKEKYSQFEMYSI